MSELEKLYEFWDVTRIVIDRSGTDGALSLELTFNTDQELVTLKLDRPNSIDNVDELIDIEHVVVSKENGTHQEFGTIKVEFENLGEGRYEFWCDEIREIKRT
jgi:hypothetical protein